MEYLLRALHSCSYWAYSSEPRNCCSHGPSILVEEATAKGKIYNVSGGDKYYEEK